MGSKNYKNILDKKNTGKIKRPIIIDKNAVTMNGVWVKNK